MNKLLACIVLSACTVSAVDVGALGDAIAACEGGTPGAWVRANEYGAHCVTVAVAKDWVALHSGDACVPVSVAREALEHQYDFILAWHLARCVARAREGGGDDMDIVRRAAAIWRAGRTGAANGRGTEYAKRVAAVYATMVDPKQGIESVGWMCYNSGADVGEGTKEEVNAR